MNVALDPGGRIARVFGAETSGHVLLYDPEGRLVFEGGLTPSRGHAGDCEGRTSLLNLLAGTAAVVSETPTYGCPIHNPDAPEVTVHP